MRRKGRKETRKVKISDAPATVMPSQATSVTDSSLGRYSADTSGCTNDVPELSVPELDNDISTDDFTSDYLSTRTTSILGVLEPSEEIEASSHFDAASVYSPSTRHPVHTHMVYRIEHHVDDEDFVDEATANSTRSINDLDVDYVVEHGRRYCGSYYMPNDDDEQVRLQLINQVYLKTFDGELTSVPLEAPTHILDIGTAVGEWAIDIAELYPDCEVVGTDIGNIFERRVPQNVFWEIDDAELEWERPSNHYDLIHLRDMSGSFTDWHHIYLSAFNAIKPGGWIEVLDFDDSKGMNSFHSLFQPGSIIHKVVTDVHEAAKLHGKPRGVGHLEPRFLVNAGYVDVQLTEHAIPLRTDDGSTGKFWLLALLNGLESKFLRLLTKYKGWDPEEVRIACDMIGQELMTLALNPKRAKSFVVKVRVLKGRKPGPPPRWSRGSFRKAGPSIQHMPSEMTEPITETDAVEDNMTDLESGYCSAPSPELTTATRNKVLDSDPIQKGLTNTKALSSPE
ncbi:S-adenosyl-L-methionine-dependent methyltransferase [Hypoxylon sp. FL1284]|nr:S-adenosyl-L-methionine-dependent methyltransferase [Hypoxylon sp. FL1284]